MIEHRMNELRENETQVSAAYRRREDGYIAEGNGWYFGKDPR